MKRNTSTIVPNRWWMHEVYDNNQSAIKYPPPVCKNAEHKFLYFLYELNKVKTKNRLRPEDYLANVILYKYGSSNIKTEAIAVKKSSRLIGNHKFGPETYLILNGPLAVTIAKQKKMSRYQQLSTHLEALRPIINNQDTIEHKIGVDIRNSHRNHDFESATNLKIIQAMIITEGYLPALLNLLSSLTSNFNKAAILKNSQQIP